MRTFDQWMQEYGVSHQNPKNKIIHNICVPLIMLTVIGFFWILPFPTFLTLGVVNNWAYILIILALTFYASLNIRIFWGMLIQAALALWICSLLEASQILLPFCVVVFVLAWIGQFYGHKVEGKKPSFLQDLAFLLIGPLWVTKSLYQRLGFRL